MSIDSERRQRRARRFLVYCPFGGKGIEAELFGADRLFDVAINDYRGQQNEIADADIKFAEVGHKWPGVTRNLPKLLTHYDYYAFLDDDVTISCDELNKLFLIGEALSLDLYQASLCSSSFYSHALLLSRAGSLVRKVSFVEIMMPVFSRAALKKCAWTFELSETGYGLDLLWAKVLNCEKMAVVDAIAARHSRPIESSKWLNSKGMTAMQELALLMQKYGLTFPR